MPHEPEPESQEADVSLSDEIDASVDSPADKPTETTPVPPVDDIGESEQRPEDLQRYIDQIPASTRKILDEEFHANFTKVIPPRTSK